MSKEEKYKQIQKFVAALLKANGFRKIKSQFIREFSDAVASFGFSKYRGFDGGVEICFGLHCRINFFALNPIFNAGKDPLDMETTFPDESIAIEHTLGYPWRITDETDIDVLINELEVKLKVVLNELDQRTSITAFVHIYDYSDPDALSRQSIRGLVQTAVAAKLCGMTREYEALLHAISHNSEGNSWFARYHLGLVSNK